MKMVDTRRHEGAIFGADKVVELVALLLLLGSSTSCSLDLGAVPFKCNTGTPKCPGDYECKGGYCVKEGTCPDLLPECLEEEPSCGDGTCQSGETPASCPEDCAEEPRCGDGRCDSGEDAASCPEDCAQPECGNDACEAGETPESCPADCAEDSCGNNSCDDGETSASCPQDCPPEPVCGDGSCDDGETSASCPQDCPPEPVCGDGSCDSGETSASCPQDCPAEPFCGDGSCDSNETASSCPQDCGCQEGQTKCAGTDSLESCEAGEWETDLCETLCAAAGYDYAIGCGYSSTYSKDVCKCGDYAPFGGMCNDDIKCETGFFCAYFPSGVDGFCTKYCSNPGGDCSGAPYATLATCSIEVGGQDACAFDCSDWYYDCPVDLYCDLFTTFCMP